MIRFLTAFTDTFWPTSCLLVYSLLATVIFSASFGSAVAVSLYVLLFLLSLVAVWRYRSDFKLTAYERWSLLLVLWLVLSTCFRPNAIEGVSFILSEYRTLLMAPFIAFGLSRLLSVGQVWTPIVLGSVFNILGSLVLIGSKYFGVQGAQVIQQALGIVADGKGSRFALDGKFIQACLMAVWSGVGFYWCRLGLSFKAVIQATFVGLVLVFVFYHGLIFADARSGFFVASATLATVGAIVISNIASKWMRYSLYGVAAMIGVFSFNEALDYPGLVTAIENTHRFIADGVDHTSIGMRLLTYQQLGLLAWDQFVFGVGGGNWKEAIRLMFPVGTSGHPFVIWNDFHSQTVWLLIKGGVVSLILYLLIISLIAKRSFALLRDHRAYGVGGLGVAICSILLLMGSMNSLFTAMRESHLVGLLLIVFGVLDRLQYMTENPSNKNV
jgi:hypothetical protein